MGIKIPGYDQQIVKSPVQVKTPQLTTDIPQEAFGAGAAQAESGYAKDVSGFGDAMQKAGENIDEGTQKIAGVMHKQEEQQVASADTQSRMNINQMLSDPEAGENGKPKGLMNRQLEDAKGITQEFDKNYSTIRQQALDSMPYQHQKRALAARMDENYVQTREGVQKYEYAQGNEAYKTAVAANIKQRVADAANIKDPKILRQAVEEASLLQSDSMRKQGIPDAQIQNSSAQLSHDMTSSSIGDDLDHNPYNAQAKLDATKQMMTADLSQHLQGQVDGGKLQQREADAWQGIQSDPTMRLADGSYDLKKIAQVAMSGNAPEVQKQHMLDYLRKQATAAETATNQQRDNQTRMFQRDALKARDNGVDYNAAHDALFKQKGYGWDPVDRADKENQLHQLYSGGEANFYDEAAKYWTPDQKLAWAQVESMAKAKFGAKEEAVLPGDEQSGVKTNLQSALIAKLKKDSVNMNPGQMLQHAQDELSKTVPHPHKFLGIFTINKNVSQWQDEQGNENARQAQISKLQADPNYAPYVGPAKAYFRKRNVNEPSPDAIKQLIDRLKGGK